MAAPKGRPQRRVERAADEEKVLFVRTTPEVIDRLEDGAVALNISRNAYVELLVQTMPVDDRGLPPWLAERADAEQLPLNLGSGKEPDPAAA